MMIHSKIKDYHVHIEEDFSFLSQIEKDENTQFVIDRKVYDLYKEYFAEFEKNS